jgi:NADPH2:quinone reductase
MRGRGGGSRQQRTEPAAGATARGMRSGHAAANAAIIAGALHGARAAAQTATQHGDDAMQAAFYERFGPAREVFIHGQVPDPVPGPGEVLVRVAASGVNPTDVKRRAGLTPAMPFPRIIPHSDGAGTIAAVGEGVPTTRLGERVWLWNAAWERAFGTAAEYVALPAAQAAPLAEGTSFAEAACLGIPAMTAHRAVFADGPVTGQTVLVTGGAGAVGHYAVQMARLGGARRVLATVSSPAKAAHAEAGGAHYTIDYRREDAAARVKALTAGEGVDRIVEVDFAGNLDLALAILRPNGVIAAYASGPPGQGQPGFPFSPLLTRDATVRLVYAYRLTPEARRAALEDIGRWLREGALTHAVACTLPLADIAAAHERVESGALIGTAVVEIAA